MATLRVGTRGSALARKQTELVCAALRVLDGALAFRIVPLASDGDLHPARPIDASWPPGGFVGTIERALLEGRVDIAVHSHKDLPTTVTSGLIVAATPPREVAHDVLVSVGAMALDDVPAGFRVGSSSARRAAQLRRLGAVEVVPIRGNVPTRLARVTAGDLDGVVLAAAGLRRLDLEPAHELALPVERFVPAPAQGALAVQTRADDAALIDRVKGIDHRPTHAAVTAERAFLAGLGGGCLTAAGALARVGGDGTVRLRGQLFSADGTRCVDGEHHGDDPRRVGWELATQLRDQLDAGEPSS